MIVNPKIREVLNEISREAIVYGNSQATQYKYIRRFMKIYANELSEEERVYVIAAILEMLHYRNVMTDHDTLMSVADVKLKTAMGVGTVVVMVLIVGAVLFRTNAALNGVVDTILQFTKILAI